jgi:hypothetical protein
MTKNKTLSLIIVLILGLLALSACATATDTTGNSAGQNRGKNGGSNRNSASQTANLVSNGDLTDVEAAGLLYMREEEKLAHDVYVKMYEKWGLQIFQNIAESESTHTDAVKALLDRYGLDDPATGMAAGEFSNSDLQSLYDDLVAQGSQSLEAAVLVGGAIEEIDILDLQKELALTENSEICLVYSNLLSGSSNHLRAFSRTSEQQTGETYQPQYLSAEAYTEIIDGSAGRGANSGYGQGRSGGRGNGDGNGKGNGNGQGGVYGRGAGGDV